MRNNLCVVLRTAKDKGFDGIIATIPGSEETLAALVETPLPVVVKNVRSPAFAARRGKYLNAVHIDGVAPDVDEVVPVGGEIIALHIDLERNRGTSSTDGMTDDIR